eukprot:GEMP01033682.1.p1 GENE.GEMP01033682.1~~GEMP01033682.1.p1  ORF type:complete len:312 (+),score=59.59 GEMP01033682.1:43-978(+)
MLSLVLVGIFIGQISGQSHLVEELRALQFPKVGETIKVSPVDPSVNSVNTNEAPIKVEPLKVNANEAPQYEGEVKLDCSDSPVWNDVRQRLSALFTEESAFGIMAPARIEPTLHRIMETLTAGKPTTDCGVGKLMIQLLAMLAADETSAALTVAMRNETLSSPVMTLVLDIPWETLRLWPFMGIFAQVAARQVTHSPNESKMDGLENAEIVQYAAGLSSAVVERNWNAMHELSKIFLEQGQQLAEEVPLGYITSLFVQAAALFRMKERPLELLVLAQNLLKGIVRTPEDLMAVLSTRWPMWGMAHLSMVFV